MASKKSIDERIDELKKKQDQLHAKEKALRQKRSVEERKNRAHRLIEIGAAVESVLKKTMGEDGIIEKKDIPALIQFLERQEKNGKYFSNAIRNGRSGMAEDEDITMTIKIPKYATESYT
ncbi:MAG: DUF3847 domain-containing protein [Lachnospiraceae bacterium]|nr:DUF3847 domain-containing protein [Lachnospiraceae bacterium]